MNKEQVKALLNGEQQVKGVEEWCPHCDREVVLPYIEDAEFKEDFECMCGEFLEPDAQKVDPNYAPIIPGLPSIFDK